MSKEQLIAGIALYFFLGVCAGGVYASETRWNWTDFFKGCLKWPIGFLIIAAYAVKELYFNYVGGDIKNRGGGHRVEVTRYFQRLPAGSTVWDIFLAGLNLRYPEYREIWPDGTSREISPTQFRRLQRLGVPHTTEKVRMK